MKKKEYIITISVISILFAIMLIIFTQNINLKKQRNKLNETLEEYYALKEEIEYLTKLQDNYELTIKNNDQLLNKKINLENEIKELNDSKNKLTKEIEKLK